MPTTTMTFEEAYELAPQQEYFAGNPPEIGWWMTRVPNACAIPEFSMRYWNGSGWSVYFTPADTPDQLLDIAIAASGFKRWDNMQYCARFWKGK